eukprot:Plantae.Rhodophyta-Purpureofilum_apyrenoidigerum.ctg33595.p1 GENE.Plantae.Rhodophyta-Purpureofilum_apyrenoidigerum.ctg33595~~Plantae.Rhodophyta-Purpureofilum_apyrenoidigerum.ctg33595.p1  ORF type:complete len:278 (+),score=48.79 Plantae.Rhodophyta-Purpureofilum_apyrenoidigerum.ctg33595:51-884(+)
MQQHVQEGNGTARGALWEGRRTSSNMGRTGTVLNRFYGKVAVVTGSTDGIGYATIRRLGREGATVIVSSRKQSNVDRAVEMLKSEDICAYGIKCHVGDRADREKLEEFVRTKFGRVDVLVLNAAVSVYLGPTLKMPEAAWDKTFDINVKSAFLCVQALESLIPRGGSIAFVSSITGFNSAEEIGAYSVTKTALLGLTKVLAKELGPRNIRVNCVAPGIIETKFSSTLTEQGVNKDVMLGRFGTTTETAAAIAFVVSEDASYMTGETLVVAGGAHSRL